MPEPKPNNYIDREQHTHTNTFMRADGTVILLPKDLFEGKGDFINRDRDGNPDGWTIGDVEIANGWFPYLGTAPEGVDGPTQQSFSSLALERNFLCNQPRIQGDPAPSARTAAKINQPAAPILIAEPAGIEGFAATTTDKPFLIRYYGITASGARTLPSLPTLVPQVSTGQSIRVILPRTIPDTWVAVGIELSEPGTSTSTVPGRYYLQREVPISATYSGSYDLTGPFRSLKPSPTTNETKLPVPGQATLTRTLQFFAAKIGTFRGTVVWADENGESLPSPFSSIITIAPDPRFIDTSNITSTPTPRRRTPGSPPPPPPEPPPVIAGLGQMHMYRPYPAPPGATGWRAYIYTEGQWHVVEDAQNAWGNARPIPLWVGVIDFTGWSSATENQYSTTANKFLVQRDLPTENTSGIESPTEPLATPVVFGAARLPPATYYAGITDALDEHQSILSPLASKTITQNEILKIVRQDDVNLVSNPDYIEVGANGLPLDHTYVTTGGTARKEGEALVLEISASTSGTTPSDTTYAMAVDPTEDFNYAVRFALENPPTGVLQGGAEIALEELNSAGTVTTTTVLGSLTAVGETTLKGIIYATGTTGLPGGSIIWQATTVQARIVERFV